FYYHALINNYHIIFHYIVYVDSFPKYKLQFRPHSFVHICNISYVYIFCIGISVLSYMLYVSIQNIFVLFGGSVFFFILLIGSRMTAAEGTTKVIFKENH